MTTTPPAISSLPAPPNPADRSTFNTLAYPWSAALPAFGASVAAVADNVKLNADEAALSTTAAAAQALIATLQASASASSALTAGAVVWVSGTTYAIGNARFSPINGQTYRRITAGAGTTDPSADATNWVIVNGLVNQAVSIPVNNLPAIRPSLDLDFANGQTVDPRITFTRASTATRTNARGLIESVASGVPRIDFDPVTGACKGLLIEEQRANLLTYSEQFDNAVWVKGGSTVTANATTAPDGALTADKLMPNNGVAGNAYTGVVLTAATHTVSIYAKAGEFSWMMFGSSVAGNVGVWFNLSTGSVGAQNSGYTGTITNVGGGFYRCSVTFTGTATTWNTTVFPTNADGALSLGNGTSGIFIWGAQLEAGAFHTSYIPTVASQVTRAADVASMTGVNFSSWYRQDEGTLLASMQAVNQTSPAASGNAASISNNTNSDFLSIGRSYTGSTNRFESSITTNSVAQLYANPAEWVAGSVASMALAYKLNDSAFAYNAVTPIADASVVIPTVSRMYIGANMYGTSGFTNGHIRSLSYYPKRCSNAELQALSTQ